MCLIINDVYVYNKWYEYFELILRLEFQFSKTVHQKIKGRLWAYWEKICFQIFLNNCYPKEIHFCHTFNFLIPISLLPIVVDLGYFKLLINSVVSNIITLKYQRDIERLKNLNLGDNWVLINSHSLA